MQEASLKIFSIFFSISLLITNLNAKEVKKQALYRGIASILDSQELVPNKADQNAAFLIYDLLNTDDASSIRGKIPALKAALIDNSRFAPFHAWIESLSAISSIHTTEKSREYCNSIKSQNPKNYEQLLSVTAINLCLKSYLSLLTAEIQKNNKLGPENKEFLTLQSQELIKKDLKNDLAKFLGRIETRGAVHAEISHILVSAYIKNKEVPAAEILKNILITYDLTTFIQRNGYNKPQNTKVMGEELDNLGRKIVALIPKANIELKSAIDNFVNFYQYNKQHLQSKTAKNRIIFTGRELSQNGQYEFSQKILSVILKDNDLESSHEALFITLWTHLMEDQNKKALNFIESNNLLDQFPNLSLKLKYWVAHTVELNRKKGMSVKLYNQLIEQNPLSFYSIMAIKNLSRLEGKDSIPSTIYNLEKINESSMTIADFSKSFQDSFIRLKLWDQFNLKDLAKTEVQFITQSSADVLKAEGSKLSDNSIKENAYILMAGAYSTNNNYIAGFNLIQTGLMEKRIGHNTYLMKSLFPHLYFDEIKKLDSDIDPIILMSLIRQESGFNPRAKSLVGARGLMQLMPTTAKMMNRKIKPHDLEKPETNLKLGIQYFKYLMKKYDGNLVFSLAAYNAGEHRVTRWQKDIFVKNEPMLKTIEKIPYQETRDYVKLIFRNMYFYKMLASNKIDDEGGMRIYDINLGFTH